MSSFSFEELSNAEVERAEAVYGGLTGDVRTLVDLAIRTRVDEERVLRARELLTEAAELLAEDAQPGPAGVHYNSEGRSWNWGNTVVGLRNAVAPPAVLERGDDEVVRSALTLGAPYEGPPAACTAVSRRCCSTT